MFPLFQRETRSLEGRHAVLRVRGSSYRPTFENESPLSTDSFRPDRKTQIDALLLKLPGVSARKINGLDAYFVSDKMFACISGDGVALRLPAATVTELRFSMNNTAAFQPGGMASSREWLQINRAEAAEYAKDLELFQSSLDFVKTSRSR